MSGVDDIYFLALLLLQIISGAVTSLISYGLWRSRGLLISGISIFGIFLAKDLLDLLAIFSSSFRLDYKFFNHSLFNLGFILASIHISRNNHFDRDEWSRILLIIELLLLDTLIDTIEDMIHVF